MSFHFSSSVSAACLAGLLALTLTGCPGPAKTGSGSGAAASGGGSAAPSAADVAAATKVFAERCTACHGPKGAGDGPASSGLDPKPANLGDAAWQATVTDKHLESVIKSGGAAVGKSPAMPGNPDLKPGVIAALRAHVRGLKK
jgi:mono/diheme cytochrome c family protein